MWRSRENLGYDDDRAGGGERAREIVLVQSGSLALFPLEM